MTEGYRGHGLGLRLLLREWRGGELAVLGASLIIAASAVTAVGFFTDRVAAAMEERAGEVLAADLAVRGDRPAPGALEERARELGLNTARTLQLSTVVMSDERSQLVDLRGVDPGYPLRGHIRLSEEAFDAAVTTRRTPDPGTVWADSRVLAALDLEPGDMLRIGEAEFRLAGILAGLPDQGIGFADVAPAVVLPREEVLHTGLIVPGSRVQHHLLVAGERDARETWRTEATAGLGEDQRLLDAAEQRAEIAAALDRAGGFLGLAALAAVMVAGVAVALSAREWARRRLDAAALMKTFGASQGRISRLYAGQLLTLGGICGLLGAGLGWLAQWGLVWTLGGLLEDPLPPAQWGGPLLLGVGTAMVLLLGFALPPLRQLRHSPPGRVLQGDHRAPPAGTWLLWVLAVAVVAAMVLFQLRDPRLTLLVLVGAAVTLAALAGGALLLIVLLRRLRATPGSGRGAAWRHGLGNLARHPGRSLAMITAFGLGLMVLALLTTVRGDLLDGWRASLPADAPNHFLINIQPGERDGVRQALEEMGASPDRFLPLVRGRLVHINDRPVDAIDFPSRRAEGIIQRDANLTWSAEPGADNRVTAGEWWQPEEHGQPLISLEEDFAEALGVTRGDRLGFRIGGREQELEVHNLRSVRWDSFQPNFFLVTPPGVLEQMPATWITSVYLAGEDRAALAGLVREYPSVTVIDVDRILEQVRAIIDRASLAVEFVFGFTLLAGLTVLFAAVQASRDQRRFESALMRALGGSRRQIRAAVAAEFAIAGTMAGLLGGAGALLGSWLLAREVFQLAYSPPWMLLVVMSLAGTGLLLAAGLAATRGVIDRSPMAVLGRGG